MTKLIALGLILGLALGCGGEKPKVPATTEKSKTEVPTTSSKMELAASVKDKTITLTGRERAKVETDRGVFEIEFYPDDAPQSVKNFIRLSEAGFYDALSFHRYDPDFVIQGGCPQGTGAGNCGWNIPLEVGKPKHTTGAVGMARAMDPNSNSCQWYVVLNGANAANLDGQYTVFGHVRTGMDVVQKLRGGDAITRVTIVRE